MYELYAVRFEWRPLWSDRAACRASLQSAPGRRQRPDPTTRWAHGHPSSCRLRRTDRVVGLGPKRRHSPPGSGGVTPRSRCRRCERVAEPKVRIRSLQRRESAAHTDQAAAGREPWLSRGCACSVGGAVGRGAPRPCSARHRRAGASQGLRQPMGSHADPLRAGREHRVRQASGRCRAIHMGRTVPVSKQDIQIIR
jgi:hypothetical protein